MKTEKIFLVKCDRSVDSGNFISTNNKNYPDRIEATGKVVELTKEEILEITSLVEYQSLIIDRPFWKNLLKKLEGI